MAKKKGGKKKKQSGEQPEQTQLASEPSSSSPEAQSEPALTDAVSEVIGDHKSQKKENKSVKKAKTQIAKFSADGYDVSSLEAMLETASPDDLKDAVKDFEEGIVQNKSINESLSGMNIAGLEKEADELKALLSNPIQHKEASALFERIKFDRRVADISYAINKMVLPSMKPRVEAMKAMLQNSQDLAAIESEFSSLKMDYKAAYAEDGVKAQIVTAQPEPPKPEAQSKVPMLVKDIFLLYRDGKFISHHTTRVVSKDQQKELFADLKTGRDFLRSPKYIPQKLNVIPGQSRNILVQSGRFTVVIIVAEGSVDPWSEKITSKVITLLEKEDQMQLKDWNGDVSALKSSGKYMQALLFAFMKLANKGKQ